MSYTEKRHDRAITRKEMYKHMKRKENILKFCGEDDVFDIEKNQSHRLNKQKIHCSCPMCTEKVSNLGFSYRDKKQLLKQFDDYDEI